MKPIDMNVNKKLLPIKGHFFLFNAGTAPLVPYLSTYARQLGFSSATVGLIYTVLPIFGLIAKPLFGVIADRFKVQKTLFILFQIVTIVSFSAIYFIPQTANNFSVDLDCGDGVTVLRSCYKKEELLNKSKVTALGNVNSNAHCDMNCDMKSSLMWQTVCEHWHLPQYCYNASSTLEYKAQISNISMHEDSCIYIKADNITLDGHSYLPHCRIGGGYKDVNLPCILKCTKDVAVSNVQEVNMTCFEGNLHYRLCSNDTKSLMNLTKNSQISDCQASCDLDGHSPWRLMEICEGWQADAAASCKPRTVLGAEYPSNLSFIGTVLLSTTISVESCVFMQLNEIRVPDQPVHYPYCVSKAQYQDEAELFHTSCNISCDNTLANEIFQAGTESRQEETTQYTKQFWLFFLFMAVSWIGQAVVVSIADAICFNLLDDKPSHYGKQRLWGSVGWGILSLLTGSLIDVFSDGAYKDYTIAFILMFVFMAGDVAVSCIIKIEPRRMSLNILKDVGMLMSSLPTVIFFLWTVAVGLCTGLLWQFLFWHLEVIAETTYDGTDYIKTLQGLVSAIQTFCGEIPFMFMSGFILKKLGNINMMSLVLFAFGIRFILYSFLTNPWWVLPIEMLQGITYGMFYPTMTSFANVVSPQGTETTVQGLVGAIFEGVGTSLGSFIGGILYKRFGGWNTFRWFGIGSLIACLLHIFAQYLLKDKMSQPKSLAQGYASVIRYEHNDMVHMMEDMTDDSIEVEDD